MMKLTAFIIIIALVQVSANTHAQRITLNQKNTNLQAVFTHIENQTGYTFFYRDFDPKNIRLDIQLTNTSIEEALEKCLNGLYTSYSIVGKNVVVAKRKPTIAETAVNIVKGFFQNIDVKGRITDAEGKALSGATITVKGSSRRPVVSDQNGNFILINVDDNALLVISFIGYELLEIPVKKDLGEIKLIQSSGKLDEVKVISTGYQNIPRERITGSVTLIDNDLLNRTVSPDFLSRLNSVTNGLLTNANSGNNLGISIRGKSTLFSSTKPLIVVDNFPFEGDINTITPNDIENISILKDAAAASIWGVKAGNGVIVVTTKKGKLNQKTVVSFNSNLTIGEKPDLYYKPQLSSSDYIELEKLLYAKGQYNGALRNSYELLSPVISLLATRNTANATAIDAQIESLKQYDSRSQIRKYLYRNSINQQYYLNINGGSSLNTYNLSAGYDVIQPNQVASVTKRFTLKAGNTFNLLKDRIQLSTDMNFNTVNTLNENATFFPQTLYPYEQIADQNGSPTAVLSKLGGGLRASYTDTVGQGRLLNWKYKPLEELSNKANTAMTALTDIRLNTALKVKILDPLSLSLNYQYYKSSGNNETINDLNSYQTRNSINQVTQINRTSGAATYPFPLGSLYNGNNSISKYNYGRAQFDYQQTFLNKHNITALAGYEIRSEEAFLNNISLVGYDPETATNIVRDNITAFPFTYGQPGSIIFNSNPANQAGTVNHYVSSYSNISYAYDKRYIMYASYRKDESNLFGVKANQKGVPLWSTGAAWNLGQEPFFKTAFFENLQVKASYGYNGNVNQSLSAYTTATPFPGVNPYGSPYLRITNPPNPSLSWERVRNINAGIDFSTRNAVIAGSIEYYSKEGLSLIGQSPIAQQTGLLTFTGNVANTKTKGLDVQLSSRNIKGLFNWSTTALLNIAKDKVTKYIANTGTNNNVVSTTSVNPIQGYPIYAIFSYKSAMLDASGNPQGFINGELSKNYTSILNSVNRDDLKFYGSAVPTVFGAVRNTFSYRSFDLSVNISYKFGYFFRTPALQNAVLYNGEYQVAEYNQRWQQSGDELSTTVPALIYPADSSRDAFYVGSESVVGKGDHIRLNDVSFSYTLPQKTITRLRLRSLSIYTYANNLGILWRANKKGVDPDIANGSYPTPKSFAIGLKTTL